MAKSSEADSGKQARSLMLTSQLVAGGGAGAITKTSIAPLERIKILMQLEVRQIGWRHPPWRGWNRRAPVASARPFFRHSRCPSRWQRSGLSEKRAAPGSSGPSPSVRTFTLPRWPSLPFRLPSEAERGFVTARLPLCAGIAL